MSLLSLGISRTANRIDPAWAALVLILLGLAILAPRQASESIVFMLRNLLQVAPFLLLSVGIAAYAKASGADNLIAKAFQGHLALMVVFASLMGALSPFCSCGVIPLIAALLSMGVPLPAVMAFWLSSPIMDPSMFVLTSGTLGLEFAVAKTLAAIAIGLGGGFAMVALSKNALFANPLRPEVGNGGCGASSIRDPKAVVWSFWGDENRRQAFAKSGTSNLLFLGKWLTLAFLLESLMLAYVPADLVAQVVGGGGLLPVLGATLVGIPAYLNGYAALPLVDGLMSQGMSPGAGMAFLVAGGMTSIPAAIAVFALTRLPTFLAYLGLAVSGAMLTGFVFGLVAA